MTVKVGINGFGRIGRLAFRRIQDVEGIEVVAINDLTDAKMLAHLLKYDTTQGRFNGTVEVHEGSFNVNGKEIKVLANRNPEELPWGELGVDIVLECTGFFTSKEAAEKHLTAGAKRVVISAPGGNDVPTIVYNTNHETLTGEETVISGASCTTNCL
ncbi:TPA: aldehyde dehydrogenase, partial [Enterococcus faecalis]|nr:aldehyde dehydrogenase [Enterococcus faecalis]